MCNSDSKRDGLNEFVHSCVEEWVELSAPTASERAALWSTMLVEAGFEVSSEAINVANERCGGWVAADIAAVITRLFHNFPDNV